jgi:hypothetical protein
MGAVAALEAWLYPGTGSRTSSTALLLKQSHAAALLNTVTGVNLANQARVALGSITTHARTRGTSEECFSLAGRSA